MKGLILSGGKGTRLYPLTYTLAKQLVPLANKPVLVRVIETIRDAGVTDIGIVVGDPTAAEIIQRIGDGSDFGVKITFIKQPSPDGLAHAVKISQDFIGDDRFFMFLGDNCLEGDIGDLSRDFATTTRHRETREEARKKKTERRKKDERGEGAKARSAAFRIGILRDSRR